MDSEKELKNYFDNLYKGIDDSIFLDSEQREVILNNDQNLLVIAGAGSGKTTTVASKVRFLIDKRNINPSEIIVISYTNKAVLELKERINNDFKLKVEVYTFHKLAYEILKKDNKNYKILSDNHIVIKSIITDSGNDLMFIQKLLRKHKDYKIKELKYDKENKYTYLTNLCSEIIKIIKNSNTNLSNIISNCTNKREKEFYIYLNKIYIVYNNYLNENNLLDFEDIINKCCFTNIKFGYKYIIVDEYQDISFQRFLFVKQLIKNSRSKLMVVGDDWQSIFGFAGSKLELFTNFKEIMGESTILKINNTYRNSQTLISKAGNFVMCNEKQIKKQLLSDKKLYDPIKIVTYVYDKILVFIKVLSLIIDEYGTDKNILLLGRYNFDINFIKKSNLFIINQDIIIYKKYPKLKIVFLTVHAAKGLGYDNVILVNGNNGLFGFPSLIENDPIKNIINDNSNMEEERRLFYVALTRTKNRIYILSHKNEMSNFVKELKNTK